MLALVSNSVKSSVSELKGPGIFQVHHPIQMEWVANLFPWATTATCANSGKPIMRGQPMRKTLTYSFQHKRHDINLPQEHVRLKYCSCLERQASLSVFQFLCVFIDPKGGVPHAEKCLRF